MKNKYLRIIAIVVVAMVLLLAIANFVLNFWLKNNLPSYIKKNSDYTVNYTGLNVELSTGNIFATGISVNSKNPKNQNVIGLQGTIDTLKISRFGLYDALVRKRISSTDLLMIKPNLNVILAKPINDKTGKKRNPVVFENIRIKEGNIQIFRHTKQKFVSVDDLNLDVENLQMTEESVEKKLPVVFDRYDIRGKNFYFRPDNVYALKADIITTKSGLMNIKNFRLVPLLSFNQFSRYFPNKRNLFDFRASEMDFKDIVFKDNNISLSNVRFESPVMKMYTTNAKKSPQKSFTYEVNLEDVAMNNAKVEILKPNGNRLFFAETLNMDIRKLRMDEETAKGNIPFAYENFLIDGKNINYLTPTQDIKVVSLALNQKSGDLRHINIKPITIMADKGSIDLNINQISFKVNDWKLENNKLKMDANQLTVDGMNGIISAASKPGVKRKATFEGIQFPLTVKNVIIKNSDLGYSKNGNPISFKNLNAQIQNIEMNGETVKNGIPFKTGNYSITTKNFSYRLNRFYQMNIGLLKFNKDLLHINNFAVKPLVSRAQFIKSIPTEKDLYDVAAGQIIMKGKWDLLSDQKFLDASSLAITGMNANIFRSKLPKDDMTEKPLYSKLLRSVKFPLFIQNFDIKNSTLVYEEDTKKSDGPGKLVFGSFNMHVKNINSAKMKGRPTQVPIAINSRFMNVSPMKVNWSFDTANMSDAFSINGNISDLPAERINPFIEPYLKVRAEGFISDLIFNFKGNDNVLNGSLQMKHKDLKVAIIKSTGEENKLLTAVANLFVRTDSDPYPASVPVDNIQRDKTKSFFNFFWQGIQEGLKKTLIGKNIEKTEKDIKNTVEKAKTTIEDKKGKIQDAKEAVKEATSAVKEAVKPDPTKKPNVFRKIFHKKEKAAN